MLFRSTGWAAHVFEQRDNNPQLQLTYDAKYENSANGFGGSVTYRF